MEKNAELCNFICIEQRKKGMEDRGEGGGGSMWERKGVRVGMGGGGSIAGESVDRSGTSRGCMGTKRRGAGGGVIDGVRADLDTQSSNRSMSRCDSGSHEGRFPCAHCSEARWLCCSVESNCQARRGGWDGIGREGEKERGGWLQ